MHELTDYQKRKLLKNPAIERVTEKQIIYTSNFKLWAVGRYLEGDSPNEIFKKKGISPDLFKPKYCQSCLKRWKKKLVEEGKESLKKDMRGTSSNSGALKKPTYEELEAIVAIQREALGYSKK